jgi:hypothetical protein
VSKSELALVWGLLRHGRGTTAFVKRDRPVVRLHGKMFQRTPHRTENGLPVYEPHEPAPGREYPAPEPTGHQGSETIV